MGEVDLAQHGAHGQQLAIEVGAHGIASAELGSKRPPVVLDEPPQMIISVPVHTAVWPKRTVGAPVVDVATQMPPGV